MNVFLFLLLSDKCVNFQRLIYVSFEYDARFITILSHSPSVEQPADEYDAAIKDRHLNKYSCRGSILTLGVGDTGQLGLGPDITERSKPAKFTAASLASAGLDEESSKSFVQVVAGGMHTVCLTEDGRVFTFGCNDEGALGRPSTDTPHSDDEAPESPIEESRPGVVRFPEDEVHIKMVCAHSLSLLTWDDRRYLTFRSLHQMFNNNVMSFCEIFNCIKLRYFQSFTTLVCIRCYGFKFFIWSLLILCLR